MITFKKIVTTILTECVSCGSKNLILLNFSPTNITVQLNKVYILIKFKSVGVRFLTKCTVFIFFV